MTKPFARYKVSFLFNCRCAKFARLRQTTVQGENTGLSMRPLGKWIAMCLGALVLAGCGQRTWNEPLPVKPQTDAYNFRHRLPKGNSQELFVVLAFSGGGTRAAAFSYGILEALRDTTIVVEGRQRRLLDEVDVITSVSGGSFVSAYYGLFGERIFKDFERKFLKRDVQGELITLLFSPDHMRSWFDPNYNRGDMAARWMAANIFEHKTFRDMGRGDLPFVIINASDLNTGLAFSFIQQQFNFLCSSILDYPVARAVTASSAVPVLFGDITVRNYRRDCTERRTEWVRAALRERDFKSRQFQVARALRRYQDPARMPVVRLVDGGITDNLGVRGSIMSPVAHYGNVPDMAGAFTQQALGRVKRVLVVVANAQIYAPYAWSLSGQEPGTIATLRASFDAAIDQLNTEAATLASLGFRRWARRINLRRKPDQPKVKVFFAFVTFDQIRDDKERAYFNSIPTKFSLPSEQVDRVRALAGRLLREQPKFQAFLKAYRDDARSR